MKQSLTNIFVGISRPWLFAPDERDRSRRVPGRSVAYAGEQIDSLWAVTSVCAKPFTSCTYAGCMASNHRAAWCSRAHARPS